MSMLRLASSPRIAPARPSAPPTPQEQGSHPSLARPKEVTLSREVHEVLTTLDDRLVETLKSGDIRLLRAAWLVAQPDEYCLETRQQLEAREAKGEAPLLTADEAVELLCQGTEVRNVRPIQPSCPSDI